MKKPKLVSPSKMIWAKIRYFQAINEISDSELADDLNATVRTLYNYNTQPWNITLGQLDKFLAVRNLTLAELLGM